MENTNRFLDSYLVKLEQAKNLDPTLKFWLEKGIPKKFQEPEREMYKKVEIGTWNKYETKRIKVAFSDMREIVKRIRGKTLSQARSYLEESSTKSSKQILQALYSGASNFGGNFYITLDNEKCITIWEICVNRGPKLKRSQPRARGKAFPIEKEYCHLTIKLLANKTYAAMVNNRKGPSFFDNLSAESYETSYKTSPDENLSQFIEMINSEENLILKKIERENKNIPFPKMVIDKNDKDNKDNKDDKVEIKVEVDLPSGYWLLGASSKPAFGSYEGIKKELYIAKEYLTAVRAYLKGKLSKFVEAQAMLPKHRGHNKDVIVEDIIHLIKTQPDLKEFREQLRRKNPERNGIYDARIYGNEYLDSGLFLQTKKEVISYILHDVKEKDRLRQLITFQYLEYQREQKTIEFENKNKK